MSLILPKTGGDVVLGLDVRSEGATIARLLREYLEAKPWPFFGMSRRGPSSGRPTLRKAIETQTVSATGK